MAKKNKQAKPKQIEEDADPSKFLNKRKHHAANEETNDLPRAYKKIMRYEQFSKERDLEKKKEKADPTPKPAPLRIKKGESMSEFSQRVNAAVPLPRAKGSESKKNLKTAERQRKKADNLRKEHHDLKQKRGRSRGSDDEDDDEPKWNERDRSPDPWASLEKKNVKPKFGEVADRPPELPKLKKFSNVPKAAGSQARREILEKERQNVIDAYRKLRTKDGSLE